MKKLMIAALMMLGTSAAFAGDSEPLKAILKAKTYPEAEQLLKTNLGQLANSEEKAKAYNHLTKLALEKFDKENAIQAANMAAVVAKQPETPYDTLGFYEAAYNATMNGLECMKYDAEPNAKGAVKPKYTENLKMLIANTRMQLVTAGNHYAGLGDQDGVLKYWGTFLDSDDNPIFAASKAQEAQFIGQVAYYSAQFANQAKQYERAEKYADIAMKDEAMREKAQTFKYAMAQRNLKTHEDSVKYVNTIKELYQREPDNEMAFGTLCNMYNELNMNAELKALIDDKLAKDPNNHTAWALKGQSLMNQNTTADNPNWDECIEAFKKAIEIDGTNPVILTYLGYSINSKAAQVNGDRAAQKALYKEAMGYLERAKEIDPNRERANWAYPLYQCYYLVYAASDPRTLEMEKLLKSN
ncbi:MAG: hypothetical protein MSA85_02220 [Prevotella sp.]|uniref:tetratricopeptide repeat protein n=1 Tax=Hallella sp. TaxID=2980186 RepID=UPI00258D1876|nr:hypothetical protein [Hallella sp.]MBS7400557.1 hypothetical protein [Prevotella sp.]MCI7433279.1 hypothetical protein [Prevotella sp.]MDD7145238.1 hypothetical protein [Hallella sp.]MDR4000605.1 hypothetical protein [Hallella sp.]MDY5925738.1 hypothetical protein [Hallella sp.]